jgi:hypothetical protein
MSEDDFTDDQREMENRLKEKWNAKSGGDRASASQHCVSMPTEYHLYTRQIKDGKGGYDTYWRFDRIEGSRSDIHREVNSKMMMEMELKKLRAAGFTVHFIKTPEGLTIEAQEAWEKEWQEINSRSKSNIEVIQEFISAIRKREGGE